MRPRLASRNTPSPLRRHTVLGLRPRLLGAQPRLIFSPCVLGPLAAAPCLAVPAKGNLRVAPVVRLTLPCRL